MAEHPDSAARLLEEYRRMLAAASTSEPLTRNPSLNLVLDSAGEPLRRLIVDLAVPHWFNEAAVKVLTPLQPEFLEDIKNLPFVRRHALGYAFHDDVRADLRDASVERDARRVRHISRQLHGAIGDTRPDQDEFRREAIFLMLAFDEDAGMDELDAAVEAARAGGQLNVTDTLVHLAEEQSKLLSEPAQMRVRYHRGLLAMDMRAWEVGARIFGRIDPDRLPTRLAASSRLNLGYCLEKSGQWHDALAHYKKLLDHAAKQNEPDAVKAALHQRLAEVYVSLRDLKRGERHGEKALALHKKLADSLGQAVSLHTLGIIREKLHDLRTAAALLHQSLNLYRELNRRQEQSRVWNDLGAIALTEANPARARSEFEQAQALKVEIGDNYGLAFVYGNMARLLVAESRDFEGALRYYRTSLALFRQFRDRLNSARVLRNIALVHELQGRHAEALEQMRAACAAIPDDSPLVGLYRKELKRFDKLARRR